MLYFKNVVMPGKDATKKFRELIAHLDSKTFQMSIEKFTENRKMKDTTSDFKKVRPLFLDEFDKMEETQKFIKIESEARLDPRKSH